MWTNWPLANLPDPEMPSGKEGFEGRDSDLGEPPELKPAVASFLQGSPETSDEEGEEMPLEPAVLDFAEWVHWKAERCNTPSWWMELSTVPREDNTRKLARQVRACPLDCHGNYRNWMQKGVLFRLPLLCHAFVGKDLCCRLIQSLPVGT